MLKIDTRKFSSSFSRSTYSSWLWKTKQCNNETLRSHTYASDSPTNMLSMSNALNQHNNRAVTNCHAHSPSTEIVHISSSNGVALIVHFNIWGFSRGVRWLGEDNVRSECVQADNHDIRKRAIEAQWMLTCWFSQKNLRQRSGTHTIR